jgi:hypothetical protein
MRLRALIAVAAVAAAAGAGAARAATPPANFGMVFYGGDSWPNYDLTGVDMTSVDWPVDLIFWGNASVTRVNSKLGWFWTGSTIYALVDDGAGSTWIGSAGRKNTLCTDTHYRLYADKDGALTNAGLGNYVVGTAHRDVNECSRTPTYGYNEQAEATVAARARAVWGTAAVQEDAVFLPDGTSTYGLLHNAGAPAEGNHVYDNDGYPTLIRVP